MRRAKRQWFKWRSSWLFRLKPNHLYSSLRSISSGTNRTGTDGQAHTMDTPCRRIDGIFTIVPLRIVMRNFMKTFVELLSTCILIRVQGQKSANWLPNEMENKNGLLILKLCLILKLSATSKCNLGQMSSVTFRSKMGTASKRSIIGIMKLQYTTSSTNPAIRLSTYRTGLNPCGMIRQDNQALLNTKLSKH